MIFSILYLLAIFVYAVVLLVLVRGIGRLKQRPVDAGHEEQGFSIVVPFRNEASNLHTLLDSIAAINYPHDQFELLLINDNSDDDYMRVIDYFRGKHTHLEIVLLHVDSLSASPKKEAIQLAIKRARYDWILTTDADCRIPSGWLKTFSRFSLKDSRLVAGPVLYRKSTGVISNLQYYDYMALLGMSMGGFGIGHPFLCSGANLAFSRSLFKELHGFSGNLDIVSGDDLFLLKKAVMNNKDRVTFLAHRSALVLTEPVKSWSELLHQRLRWISKTKRVGSVTGTFVSIIGLMANLFLLMSMILLLSGYLDWMIFLTGVVLKISADNFLIRKTAMTFGQQTHIHEIILISAIYPVFVLLIALRSFFPSFRWKGRTYSA